MLAQNLTRETLENVLWHATVSALGLDASLPEVQKRVRISWPTAETGGSNWLREENVVFLRIVPGVDDYANQHDSVYRQDPDTGAIKEIVTYHRCYAVTWVCYGPDADDDADAIRIGLLRDSIRQYLHTFSLAFQPHIPNPNRIPEMDETGEWWERCDLTAQCYALVRREYDASEMRIAPSIIMTTE